MSGEIGGVRSAVGQDGRSTRCRPRGRDKNPLGEVDAAEGALKNGKIKCLYKVSAQRRVLGIIDADSHDELDQLFQAGLPMAHVLEWEEIIPVREHTGFGADVRRRWQ